MNTLDYLRGQFDTQKLWLDERFTTLHNAIDEGKAVDKEQNDRLDCLEKRKWRNRYYSFGGGVLGGFLAYFTTQAKRLFNGM